MESKGFRRESLVARSVRVAGCEISLKASRGYDLCHRSRLSFRFVLITGLRIANWYRFSRRKKLLVDY